jgi:predicted pyridoxine 5'-phosphate oxidase superfamily flavin-nucleotide-binding protein
MYHYIEKIYLYFQIALCMTVHTLTPDNIFTEGLNWGISYDLPNESKPELEPFLQLRKDKIKPSEYYEDNKYGYTVNNNHNYYNKPSNMVWNNDGKYYLLPGGKKYYKADYHYLQRRYRRDLYTKLEVIINA